MTLKDLRRVLECYPEWNDLDVVIVIPLGPNSFIVRSIPDDGIGVIPKEVTPIGQNVVGISFCPFDTSMSKIPEEAKN